MKTKDVLNKYKWIIISLGMVTLEYLLFRSYVLRENIGLIPRNSDPSVYLNITYDTYFSWLSGNKKKVLIDLTYNCMNTCAPQVNAFSLFVFGYSRYSLIVWNFIGLAIYQFLGGYMVFRFTEKRSVQHIFNGSLLLLGVHFIFAGDLADCRLDYFTFCMIGVFSLAWSIFFVSKEKMYFWIAALFAGISIFVRFVTVVYIVIYVGVSLGVYIYKEKEGLKQYIAKIFYFGAICLIGGGWAIITNMRGVLAYYIGNHTGDRGKIWEFVGNWKQQISYYPVYWIKEILGLWFMLICILMIVFYFGIIFLLKRKKYSNDLAIFCNIVFLLIQYIVLTLDKVKTWTTTSYMIGAVMSILVLMSNQVINFLQDRLNKKIIETFVVAIFMVGMMHYVIGTTSEHYEKYDPHVDEIYRVIDQYIDEMGKDTYTYMAEYDGLIDVLDVKNISIYEYENKNRKISFESPMDYLNTDNQAEKKLYENLRESELVIISKEGWGEEPSVDFGTNMVWERNREKIWNYLVSSSDYEPLIETTYNEKPIAIFINVSL